jgi:hypothetical protein
MRETQKLEEMAATRSNRWIPSDDDAFRKMAEANIRPELIAAKLNRSVRYQDTRLRNRAPVEMVQGEGEMTKTPGQYEPPKPITKAERAARKAFKGND